MKKSNPFRTFLYLTHRLFPSLADCVYETMYFIQRGFNGWSERDCWAIDSHLDEHIPAVLRWLKENKHGVPNDFVEMAYKQRVAKYKECLGESEAVECWKWNSGTDEDVEEGSKLYDAMLDKIIEGFEAHKWLSDSMWESNEEYERNKDAKTAKFEHAMGLLTKYYDTLWD